MPTTASALHDAPQGPLVVALRTVRGRVACDAVAVLRFDERARLLRPVAVEGLSDEIWGRVFPVDAHPRFAQLLASGAPGMRFGESCTLPDPYDGLVEGHRELLPVHDCMGIPVHARGRLWGLLTLDALSPRAFADVDAEQRLALAHVVEAALDDAAPDPGPAAPAGPRVPRAPRCLEGRSAPLHALLRDIELVAPSDLGVLLLGETGVGKELVALRIHERSERRARPLVQINCAALPESLADSELFGHRRGAFTGAHEDRPGRFEVADRGTLLLDEVGELPLPVQAKLLRVLQTGEVQRPGTDRIVHVDVRVLAATNRDLRAEVDAGRFRADLYHRLAAFPLRVPPLRERGRDVLVLAGSFLEEHQHRLGAHNLRFTTEAKAWLLRQPWPGNVRELEHAVARAALRAVAERGGPRWVRVEPRHLEGEPATAAAMSAAPRSPAPERGIGLREATDAFQRQWIEEVLRRHRGVAASAAREAGLDRSNFSRLMKRLGLA